jgi:hypothetical protein
MQRGVKLDALCATAASNEALEQALSGIHNMALAEQREALARLRRATVQSAADPDRVATGIGASD